MKGGCYASRDDVLSIFLRDIIRFTDVDHERHSLLVRKNRVVGVGCEHRDKWRVNCKREKDVLLLMCKVGFQGMKLNIIFATQNFARLCVNKHAREGRRKISLSHECGEQSRERLFFSKDVIAKSTIETCNTPFLFLLI